MLSTDIRALAGALAEAHRAGRVTDELVGQAVHQLVDLSIRAQALECGLPTFRDGGFPQAVLQALPGGAS